jgi:hypothetical protein
MSLPIPKKSLLRSPKDSFSNKKIAFFAFREYLTINFVHVTLHQSLPSFFMCSCLKERFGDEGKERICASRKFSPSKKQQKNELLFSQNKIVYLETHSY